LSDTNAPDQQTFIFKTDAPHIRASYETLSSRELACKRGSLIMRRHSNLKTFEHLTRLKDDRGRQQAIKKGRTPNEDGEGRASTTPMLILFSMAILVGDIH
jgi:hypothetical protein